MFQLNNISIFWPCIFANAEQCFVMPLCQPPESMKGNLGPWNPRKNKRFANFRKLFTNVSEVFASFRELFATFGARNGPKTIPNNPKRCENGTKRRENGAKWCVNGPKRPPPALSPARFLPHGP